MCVWFFFGFVLFVEFHLWVCVGFFFIRARFVISVRRIVASPVLYTPSPSSWPLPPSKSMCMRFFLFRANFRATRCYAQSHTDRKREIGESVNRITVHCELICLHHTHLFSLCFSFSLSSFPSLNLFFSQCILFLYLFIYFFARSFNFFLI